jgi:hypothetical protein
MLDILTFHGPNTQFHDCGHLWSSAGRDIGGRKGEGGGGPEEEEDRGRRSRRKVEGGEEKEKLSCSPVVKAPFLALWPAWCMMGALVTTSVVQLAIRVILNSVLEDETWGKNKRLLFQVLLSPPPSKLAYYTSIFRSLCDCYLFFC